MSAFEDDHRRWLAESPEYAAAYRRARERMERSVHVPCAWNLCRHDVDPLDEKIVGGVGPVMCPCDHLPGWRSERVAGQAKPSVPVKATGRHGSRVTRSQRRHALPDMRAFGDWLVPLGVNW